MKCPKCGCENDDDYNFCKQCGAKRKDDIQLKTESKNIKVDPISGPSVSNSIFNRKTILLGLLIIVIVAILAIGLNNLNVGGISGGNEAIININEHSSTASGKYLYEISFTLTNAPDNANTYYVKATWYDGAGKEVLSKSKSLEYCSIDDDHTMDVFVQGDSKNPLNISKCVVEVTDNQGQEITSTHYNWKNY